MEAVSQRQSRTGHDSLKAFEENKCGRENAGGTLSGGTTSTCCDGGIANGPGILILMIRYKGATQD